MIFPKRKRQAVKAVSKLDRGYARLNRILKGTMMALFVLVTFLDKRKVEKREVSEEDFRGMIEGDGFSAKQ